MRAEPFQPLGSGGLAVEGDADFDVVIQNLPGVQFVQHLPHADRICAAGEHQFIGGDTPVFIGLKEGAEDVQIGLEVAVVLVAQCGLLEQFFAGAVQTVDAQAAGENAHVVFLALEQAGVFQRGNGDAHFGVGAVGVRVDARLFGNFQQNFAAGGDNFAAVVVFVVAVFAVNLAQRLEDGLNVVLREAGVFQQTKLHVHVRLVIEQDAARGFLVAPGAPGFLQVVFQRSGRVQMDDQTHVVFVDAHAKGIGGGDEGSLFAVDEVVLHLALFFWLAPAVKIVAFNARAREIVGQFFRGALAGAEDDGALIIALRFAQQFQHGGVFIVSRHRAHLIVEVVAPHAAFQTHQFHAQFFAQMRADVVHHILLGSGGKTKGGGGLLRLDFAADALGNVEIIRAKIVPPLGKTVRLIKHPGGDFAVPDGVQKRAAAELLGGDKQHAQIAQPQFVQHVFALQRGEHPVEITGAFNAALDHAVDLILHQRLQRRDDDGERARAVKPCQRGKLVTQRFAAAGGQNGKRRRARKNVAGNGLLQRVPVGRGGRGAKIGNRLKVVAQQRARVVLRAAPLAARVGAGRIAQTGDEFARARKLVIHPRRQHGIAPGDAQPGNGVSQRFEPIGLPQEFVAHMARRLLANLALTHLPPGSARLIQRGAARLLAQAGKKTGQPLVAILGHKQIVQAQGFVWMLRDALAQRLGLFQKKFVSKPRILFRVVARGGAQLVILDQMVIGILRKGDGGKFQRIDDRQLEERQRAVQRLKFGAVERGDVVPKNKRRPLAKPVQPRRPIPVFARHAPALIRIRTPGANFAQHKPVLARSNFNVQTQTFGARRRGRCIHGTSAKISVRQDRG